MADRPERVSDFVRNAGCKSPQRRQFHLLGLLSDFAQVINEHQDLVTPFLIELGEVGLHHG